MWPDQPKIWVVLFISISVIFSLLAMAKDQSLNHDKFIICSVLPQWSLDAMENDFNKTKADWTLCTHVHILDYYDNGKWHSFMNISNSTILIDYFRFKYSGNSKN